MSMFANPTFSNNTALNIGIIALGIVPENYSLDATVPQRKFLRAIIISHIIYLVQTQLNSGTKNHNSRRYYF